jgi:hypothetical protein
MAHRIGCYKASSGELFMDETKTPQDTVAPDKPSSKEGSLKHVVRTGLPPGIDVQDWKDPGKASPKGPADDRS